MDQRLVFVLVCVAVYGLLRLGITAKSTSDPSFEVPRVAHVTFVPSIEAPDYMVLKVYGKTDANRVGVNVVIGSTGDST